MLPSRPAFYAHGDYMITFGNQFGFAELTSELDFETAHILDTAAFLDSGHEATGVTPEIARNIATYLVGEAWDAFMASKNLSSKKAGRGKRSTWYPRDGLITNNRVTVAEPRKKKVPIQLVGSVKHYRKTYRWHFGVFPTVDLRLHMGILLSPKALISVPYKRSDHEVVAALDEKKIEPVLIDDKKVLKALNWWNHPGMLPALDRKHRNAKRITCVLSVRRQGLLECVHGLSAAAQTLDRGIADTSRRVPRPGQGGIGIRGALGNVRRVPNGRRAYRFNHGGLPWKSDHIPGGRQVDGLGIDPRRRIRRS